MLVLLAAMGGVVGCAGFGGDSAEPVLLDEMRGLFRGVGIGSSSAEVRGRFGEPPAFEGFAPLEPDTVKGPYAFSVPNNATPTVMRYERAAFILADDRVYGFVTSDEGAMLRRKVGVGDVRACTGRLTSRRYIWFGGDPISNITVGVSPLGRPS